MHGYNDFFTETKIAFKSIIDKYNPLISIKKNEDADVYQIIFDFQHCRLILGFDHQDLQSRFVNPSFPNIEYHVFDVLEIINPNYEMKIRGEKKPGFSDFFETLENLSYVINKYLYIVVEGDFSWHEIYMKKKEKEKKILKKLWSLDYNDPIYQKFTKGDLSWISDLSNYTEE